jgi:hypothetical protein
LQKQVGVSQIQLPKLPEGEFDWSVRAIDPLLRPGAESKPRYFRVTFGETLQAVKPKFEEVQ